MSSAIYLTLPQIIARFIFVQIKRFGIYLFRKIAANPLAFAIIFMMVVGYSISLLNALFWQVNPHPAPLFNQATQNIQNMQPMQNEPKIIDHSTNSIAVNAPIPAQPKIINQPVVAPIPAMPNSIAKIDHEAVKNLQKNLQELGFFNDKIDGYYGPNTANAIREFQKSIGQKPNGALTEQIIILVNKAKNKTAINPVILETNIPNIERQEQISSSSPISQERISSDPLLEIVNNAAQNVGQANPNAQKTINEHNEINEQMVKQVQRGLASLGFLQGKIDGIAGEATAKAIRNFEIYHNFEVTGEVSPELVDLLKQAGAKID